MRLARNSRECKVGTLSNQRRGLPCASKSRRTNLSKPAGRYCKPATEHASIRSPTLAHSICLLESIFWLTLGLCRLTTNGYERNQTWFRLSKPVPGGYCQFEYESRHETKHETKPPAHVMVSCHEAGVVSYPMKPVWNRHETVVETSLVSCPLKRIWGRAFCVLLSETIKYKTPTG